MKLAIGFAELGEVMDEVPVGAILVRDGEVIAGSCNLSDDLGSAIAHAEILLIQKGNKILGKYLADCEMYVTLEPCLMCAYAISLSRVRRLYFGAYNLRSGGIEDVFRYHSYKFLHKMEIYGGILERECSEIMKSFFVNKRSV